jgi:hypothetical protein
LFFSDRQSHLRSNPTPSHETIQRDIPEKNRLIIGEIKKKTLEGKIEEDVIAE